MTEEDCDAVLAIEVEESQRDFVDPIADVLKAHAEVWDDHVVVANDTIIGFFQIDAAVDGPCIPEQIEFHEVRIDRRQQGKGYGKAFLRALRSYLAKAYPGANAVCLTVNFRNSIAYAVYEAGGFIDTGDVDLHGGAGPQHIMTMPLRSTQEP